MKYLAKLHLNWADEIDFTGFAIVDEHAYSTYISQLKELAKRDYDVRIWFGTNEDELYTPDQLLQAIIFTPLTDAEVEVLTRLDINDNIVQEIMEEVDDQYRTMIYDEGGDPDED